jgi:GMP synthase-like glutamine amidotransferase
MQKLAADRMAHAAQTGLPVPSMATATAQGHQDNVTQLANAASLIHKAATTKKRIIRDPSGKAIGIEPIPEMENPQ